MQTIIYTIKYHVTDENDNDVFQSLEEAQDHLNSVSELWPNAVIVTKTVDSLNQ